MRLCPKCGAIMLVTTAGDMCQNCGWGSTSIITTGRTSEDTVNLPLIISDESSEARALETDIKDLTDRVSALEADIERLKKRIPKEPIILSVEGHERAKEDLLKALEESNTIPVIELPKPIRYVYIIRELTEYGWDIVDYVCYSTFESAKEAREKLIKFEQNYDASNLSIIQVKVKE